MLAAELFVHHSRALSPTRRVGLGRLWLPATPPPGFGGLLLAGIVAAGCSALEGDDETLDRFERLLQDLEQGRRVVQPRVFYRYQTDKHGLDLSHHRLFAHGERVELAIDGHGAVLPQMLAAVYAASKLSSSARPAVFRLLRRATRWTGGLDHRLIEFLHHDDLVLVSGHGEAWAMHTLRFGPDDEPSRREIQARFRTLLRDAHPDHGGEAAEAAARIAELSEARQILLRAS